MSFRNRLVLPLILSSLAVLAGCGSSGSGAGISPPTGGFSNSNLSGTYVFSTTGIDPNGNFQAITGSFIADGNGHVTGGFYDLNNPAFLQAPATAVTGGSYNVGADGRPASTSGLLTLGSAVGTLGFDFVLNSSEGGLLTEFDSNGSGSGSLQLQTTVSQSEIEGQSFTFSLNGVSSNVAVGFCGTGVGDLPFTTVGSFTLDSNGNIVSGIEDVNSGCTALYGTAGTPITGGSVSLATTPGTATITSVAGTYTFDVYPVTATDMKFIETNSVVAVAGDVFSQSTTVPTGNNVFALAGFDGSLGLPMTAVGLLITDGAGNITTASTEDSNDGSALELSYSGTYSAVSGGRSLFTLNGFVNGEGGFGNTYMFAAYPSSGGMQLVEVDGLGLTLGAAYLQGSTPTLASGQGYGMNLSGLNFNNGEEDDIAEFTNTSGSLSPGKIDYNNPQIGSTSWGNGFSGTYAADSTVAGRGTITNSSTGYSMVTYNVNGGAGTPTAVVIGDDGIFYSLGTITTQTASASSNAAMRQLRVLSLKAGAKKAKPAWKKK